MQELRCCKTNSQISNKTREINSSIKIITVTSNSKWTTIDFRDLEIPQGKMHLATLKNIKQTMKITK